MSETLVEMLQRGESRARGYNDYNRYAPRSGGAGHFRGADREIDFSEMTLGEIRQNQGLDWNHPDKLHAVGRYQIIGVTLQESMERLGLDPSDRFTPEVQDRILVDYLLKQKPGRADIRDYITGQEGASLADAQLAMAREWASVANPQTGRSEYPNNHASITPAQSGAALESAREQYQTAIAAGKSTEDAWRTASGLGVVRTVGQPELQQPQAQQSGNGNGTWPAPGNYSLTKGGGGQGDGGYDSPRPAHKDRDGHDGVDIQGKIGDPIAAFKAGTVVSAGVVRGYGNTIDIRHADGAVTRYAHLDSINVKAGQTVEEGQQIGKLGDSGNAKGLPHPHLHFEYRKDGKDQDPMPHLNGARRQDGTQPSIAEKPAQNDKVSQAMADGVLKLGDRGPEVREHLEKLDKLGYRGPNGESLLADKPEIYGPAAKFATERLQEAHGLTVDGKAGKDTLTAIERAGRQPLVSEATHPNHGLFSDVSRRITEQTGQAPKPEVAANVTMQMMENGIRTEQDVKGLAVRGTDVHVQGPTPGVRTSADLSAPPPDMQAMSDHMSKQTQEHQNSERQTQQQTRATIMA